MSDEKKTPPETADGAAVPQNDVPATIPADRVGNADPIVVDDAEDPDKLKGGEYLPSPALRGTSGFRESERVAGMDCR